MTLMQLGVPLGICFGYCLTASMIPTYDVAINIFSGESKRPNMAFVFSFKSI